MDPITVLIIVMIAVAFSVGILAHTFNKGFKLQQERIAIETEKTNKKLDELREILLRLDKNFSRHTTDFAGKFIEILDSIDTRFGSELNELKRAVERGNSDISAQFSKESKIISRAVAESSDKNASKLSKAMKNSTGRILKKLTPKRRVIKKKPKLKAKVISKKIRVKIAKRRK